jgi:hypothetical protein
VSYLVVIGPMLMGMACGVAMAWTAVFRYPFFWVPSTLSAAALGAVIGIAPVDLIWPATAAFCTGVLIAFWFAGTNWRDGRDWRDGGGGPDPDPPWWPDFESQFSQYCRQRPRERQPAGKR